MRGHGNKAIAKYISLKYKEHGLLILNEGCNLTSSIVATPKRAKHATRARDDLQMGGL